MDNNFLLKNFPKTFSFCVVGVGEKGEEGGGSNKFSSPPSAVQ